MSLKLVFFQILFDKIIFIFLLCNVSSEAVQIICFIKSL